MTFATRQKRWRVIQAWARAINARIAAGDMVIGWDGDTAIITQPMTVTDTTVKMFLGGRSWLVFCELAHGWDSALDLTPRQFLRKFRVRFCRDFTELVLADLEDTQ